MTDVFLVTPINYPILFTAFELISHDCGRQAGHKNYAIPMEEWLEKIDNIEWQLRQLREKSAKDFHIFCVGDEHEMKIIEVELQMEDCNRLLQRFFEEFQ